MPHGGARLHATERPLLLPGKVGRNLVIAVASVLAVACGEVATTDVRPGGVHPAGWADAHGAALRAGGHDLDPCYACHREGEESFVCNECHTKGPESCDTCHATPPPPHAAHGDYPCGTCHVVPGGLRAPGHLQDRGPGDVRFAGGLAGSAAAFNGETCSDTRCHAGPGAALPTPAWAPREIACGDCHSSPPPEHPQDRCDRCHTGGGGDGHVDGRVAVDDARRDGCDACHGAAGDPAPPPGLSGSSDPADPGVGAHLAHLRPAQSAPVACETCHVVPRRPTDPGHLDGVTQVLVGRYAAGTCADTGCHGSDRPTWTGEAPCGSCHGTPPAGHPAGDCARCHLTAAPGGGIALPAAHVDGRVDAGGEDCAACHGDGGRVPPGGSHAAHARYACATCHPAGTHLDGAAQVAIAAGGTFERGRCADAACHGPNRPVWGRAETVEGCGSCHGAPPADHPEGACATCHPAERHADGRLDVALPEDCGACHLAEPVSGAHAAHRAGTRAAVVPCGTCHRVPERPDAPGHLDAAPVEVVLATGVVRDGTCADTACHAQPGAGRPAPAWTDGPQACDACHGLPPPAHWTFPCATCHSAVVDADNRIIAPARHADGRVDLR